MMGLVNIDSPYASVIGFWVMAMLAFVPAAPIPVMAGLVGASFSLPVALTINVGGTVVGCVGMFVLCRYVLQSWARKQMQRYRTSTGFLKLLDENPFLAVLIARLVPIMPSAVVNAVAGITTMPLLAFSGATLLGKLPALLTFTIAGGQADESLLSSIVLVGLYALIVTLVARKIRARKNI